MADAQTVITNLGQQIAALTIDKAVLEAEVISLRAQLQQQAGVEVASLQEVAE